MVILAISDRPLFKSKKIRKTLYKNEWCFSVIDVIKALTDIPIVVEIAMQFQRTKRYTVPPWRDCNLI